MSFSCAYNNRQVALHRRSQPHQIVKQLSDFFLQMTVSQCLSIAFIWLPR